MAKEPIQVRLDTTKLGLASAGCLGGAVAGEIPFEAITGFGVDAVNGRRFVGVSVRAPGAVRWPGAFLRGLAWVLGYRPAFHFALPGGLVEPPDVLHGWILERFEEWQRGREPGLA